MTTRPILFSAPMVRALLAGAKTQTRRICKLPFRSSMPIPEYESFLQCCPHGQEGDTLWVRETCRAHEITDAEAVADTWKLGDRLGEDAPCGLDGVVYLADNAFREIESTKDAADKWVILNTYRGQRGATVPPIHMPRWASRITLEIIDVRVERLQDISEDDAIAEGVDGPICAAAVSKAPSRHNLLPAAVHGYAHLWESINGPGSWDANPWVWVISFARVQP